MLCAVFGTILLLTDLTEAVVDCGIPTYTLDVDQTCIELATIRPPEDTTDGAYVAFSCASLLIRTKAPFDYCPVKRCQISGLWSDAKLSCGGATECYNSSSTYLYEGRRTCTVSGRHCQRWDSQTPHTHNYTDNDFPNNNITQSSAYCRDPGGTRGEAWCFTTDPGVEWETCGVPDCTAISIGQGTCPNDYCGDPISGFTADNPCISYTSTTDGSRNVRSYFEYHCTSLLTDFSSLHDYCPIKVCQNDTYWSTTKLSCGTNECYTPGQSQQYQGRRICTLTGFSCRRWDSHDYTNDADFPDVTVSMAASYCRDPGGVYGQPWCFITPAGGWDYCGVQECSSLPTNAGTCATTAFTTTHTTPATSTGYSRTLATVVTSTITSTDNLSTVVSNYKTYIRVNNDMTGFTKLTTIPTVQNSIGCARLCSEGYYLICVFLTFDAGGLCSLYTEDISSITNIPCTTQKCYIHNSLL